MTAPALSIVPPAPTLAEQLTQAIADYDAGEFEQAKRRALIAELGREYIAERNPDHREFVRPSMDRLRRELGG